MSRTETRNARAPLQYFFYTDSITLISFVISRASTSRPISCRMPALSAKSQSSDSTWRYARQ